MFGGGSGDRVLRMITWRGSFSQILERNAKILVGDEAEEGKITYHGNF